MKPAALMIHVEDIDLALAWYQKAFPMAEARYMADFDMTLLFVNDFILELVKADTKVASGKCGTVLYWAVDSITDTLIHFKSIGANLYRGPLEIEDGLSLCQVEDPFGNLIGIRGKLTP